MIPKLHPDSKLLKIPSFYPINRNKEYQQDISAFLTGNFVTLWSIQKELAAIKHSNKSSPAPLQAGDIIGLKNIFQKNVVYPYSISRFLRILNNRKTKRVGTVLPYLFHLARLWYLVQWNIPRQEQMNFLFIGKRSPSHHYIHNNIFLYNITALFF